jgi:hypothetical protein
MVCTYWHSFYVPLFAGVAQMDEPVAVDKEAQFLAALHAYRVQNGLGPVPRYNPNVPRLYRLWTGVTSKGGLKKVWASD